MMTIGVRDSDNRKAEAARRPDRATAFAQEDRPEASGLGTRLGALVRQQR